MEELFHRELARLGETMEGLAEELAPSLSRAALIMVDDAGHVPILTHPTWV